MPNGDRNPECSPTDENVPGISIAISSGDHDGEGLDEGEDAERKQRAGDTFFVGVNMLAGQRAQDQEYVLRVSAIPPVRLVRDAWSMAMRLRKATNEYAPPLKSQKK